MLLKLRLFLVGWATRLQSGRLAGRGHVRLCASEEPQAGDRGRNFGISHNSFWTGDWKLVM